MLSFMLGSSPTINMLTPVGIPDISIAAVVCLIILLSFYEVLSASKLWSDDLRLLFNMTTWPLVATFFSILISRVMEILSSS